MANCIAQNVVDLKDLLGYCYICYTCFLNHIKTKNYTNVQLWRREKRKKKKKKSSFSLLSG